MAIGTLTHEKVQEVCADRDKLNSEVDDLKRATPTALWTKDLDALERELDEQDKNDARAEEARKELKGRVMTEAVIKVSRQAPKNPPKNNNKANDAELAAKTMEVPARSAMELESVPEVVKPKGSAAPKKAPAKKKEMPTSVLKDEDEDCDAEVLELKERLAAYNLHSSPDGSSSGMETEVPQVPAAAAKKKEPSRRAASKKKPSVSVTVISDDEDNDEAEEDFDDDDFEIEEVAAAPAANKKGGRCCTEKKQLHNSRQLHNSPLHL